MRLKELLDYDPHTGVFVWNVATGRRVKPGSVAGHRKRDGYIRIRIDGEPYRAHRLAFVFMTGECPEFIDHINGDTSDNRIGNLRECTVAQNQHNQKPQKGRSSKFKGVSWAKRDRRWTSAIKAYGIRKHLGSFTSEIDAAMAYDKAASELFGDFAKTNRSMGLL